MKHDEYCRCDLCVAICMEQMVIDGLLEEVYVDGEWKFRLTEKGKTDVKTWALSTPEGT
jgi:hypothetical protein